MLLWAISNKAQNSDTIQSSKLILTLPLLDLPYQNDGAKTVNEGNPSLGSFFKGYSNPSMQQSLDISTDLYTLFHYAVTRGFQYDSLKS